MRGLGQALLSVCICAVAGHLPFSLAAQEVLIEPRTAEQTDDGGLGKLGRTAEIGGTLLGERQEADQAAAGRTPLARLNNRISNRVQNRIANRIDEDYDVGNDAGVQLERAQAAGRMPPR